MKIALHYSSSTFFREWKVYCEVNNIDFKIVNCYDNDIFKQLDDCDALMWHHDHISPKDALFAKQLLFSIEHSGKKAFPNFFSSWHFDDKLGQKYLFEAANIQHVPTYAFYSKAEAFQWAKNAVFPKVFKLRKGAGARNVRLVKDFKEAKFLINKAFGSGFRQYDAWGGINECIRKMRDGKALLSDLIKALIHVIYPIQLEKSQGREKGYVYFQDFIPNNEFDIRVIVIKDKAYGMKRMVRGNDFRASGSSIFVYDSIDPKILKLAFDTVTKLKLQSAAFDFVYDLNNNPLIIEVSYGFGTLGSSKCKGYYTNNMEWVEGPFNPFGWMIDDLIEEFRSI